MGSVSLSIGEGTARFSKGSVCSSAVNVLMLFSVIATNLFAFYSFSYHPTALKHNYHSPKNLSLISEKVSAILREIGSSQQKLAQMEKKLLDYESIDLSRPNIAEELKVFLNHYQLPLGKDSRTGITEMVASVGHSCYKSVDLLSQFMSYKVDSVCPDDWSLGQKLILQGCEPLPRRRCFAKTIPKLGLHPFPASLWRNVSEKIYSWSGLGCKNFDCLSKKKLNRDCAGCFDIVEGYETQRYVKARSKIDFLIDDVLVMAKDGLRIGFDISGGSGTFAARMSEKNGAFPLYLSLDHRFPFYDHVFDLVHIGNGLDIGGEAQKLEFLMFDVDRVVRAGGLVWLDNLYCSNANQRRVVSRLIDRFGYKKLKWVAGDKLVGSREPEVYLSAVLQKPIRVLTK
ncbi:hypothetical protein F511_30983 [Dorcoceras hygrometricum]|uniref:Uncharacterized protein n=1 Tax=Dorcoceras hygrometricum TaxID=472368 RepID=A0A2Z7CH77_9LAMI|nr:hypothetical protein F511_30983 [Dorcoceras hygrometricum]